MADPVEQFYKLPLNELEELAFAVQIDYEPPLKEKDRKDIIRELTWILDHKDEINEDAIMEGRRKRRMREGKMCDQVNAAVTNENLLLMSDQQLIFFPFVTGSGEKRYYCFTRYEVAEYILKEKINPYTNEPFEQKELDLFNSMLKKKPYPIIYIDGLISEIEARLGEESLKYKIMEYRQLTNEWVAIVESVLKDFKTGIILDFATDLSTKDYILFLTDSFFTKSIDPKLSRDDAATQVMRAILEEYNNVKNIDEGSAKLIVTRLTLAIDEFIYMIRNKVDYYQLLEVKGKMTANGVPELYWKPKNLRESEYENGGIALRYFVDDNDEMDGLYLEYYENGNKAQVLTYVKGKQIGLQETYYENGNPKVRQNSNENENVEGIYEEYYENGNIEIRANNKNGIYEGIYERYYENGNIMNRVNYKAGKRNGISERYNNKGDLIVKNTYKNDKYDGLQEEYYENSKIKLRENYKAGKKNGVTEKYDNKGNLMNRNTYKDDKLAGLQEEYYKEGKIKHRYYLDIVSTVTRNKVPKIGLEEFFDTEGNLVDSKLHLKGGYVVGLNEIKGRNGKVVERFFIDEKGRKQGKHEKYNSNGKLEYIYTYKNDKKVGSQEEYYNGKIKQRYTLNDKGTYEGMYEMYDTDGRPKEFKEYKNGKQIGLVEEYEIGKLSLRYYTDKKGDVQGVYETYENGRLRGRYNYKDGEQEGLQESFHSNGNLEGRWYYKNGKEDGNAEFFREDGSLESVANYVNGEQVSLEEYDNEKGKEDEELELVEEYENEKLVSRFYKDKDGQIEGILKSYYEDGTPQGKYSYSKGIRDGKQETYYPNGNVMESFFMVDDMITADLYHYNENGTLEYVATFLDDEEVKRVNY